MSTFKKPSSLPSVSTLADTDLFPAMTAAGAFKRLSWASLKALVKSAVTPDAATATAAEACDAVMIAYARKSDGYVLYSKIEKWAALQASGETALGVLVNYGDCRVILAPDDDGAGIPWSSAHGTPDTDTSLPNITSKSAAIKDADGAANTAAILAASKTGFITNTTDYAAGFCNAYSRTIQYTATDGTKKTAGLPAGKWYLPSLRELWAIYTHLNAVQRALGSISGAKAMALATHWSSTESSSSYAWNLYFSTGILSINNKSTGRCRVRPCAAFL